MTSIDSKIPVSVLIPAKNEEANLPACLESVKRADEVFIVDSQSSDRSAEIAESYGAKVVQFHFNGRWPKKKNWSLENLPFHNEWVLIVDCDERITPELWDEIATTSTAESTSSVSGFVTGVSIPTGTYACSSTRKVATRTSALKKSVTQVTTKFMNTSSLKALLVN
jgi:glycosyltransferase involved in cell wall biosynthesis